MTTNPSPISLEDLLVDGAYPYRFIRDQAYGLYLCTIGELELAKAAGSGNEIELLEISHKRAAQ